MKTTLISPRIEPPPPPPPCIRACTRTAVIKRSTDNTSYVRTQWLVVCSYCTPFGSGWRVSLAETESWYSSGVTTSAFFFFFFFFFFCVVFVLFFQIIKQKTWHLQLRLEFQQFFNHITTVSGCDRERNAHFYSASSLKYHAPDTRYDTTHSHIILTLGRPFLALPRKSECQARSG